jgi:5-methylcytosine-specific restriction endonuclease McrA
MPSLSRLNHQRRHDQRRRHRARLRHIAWLQQHGPCCQCGSWDHLELDHVIRTRLGDKSKPSQDLWAWAEPRRQAELTKCQVLCRSCHRKKTGLELRKYEHGLNFYQRHGCRCLICRGAAALMRRQHRLRHGLPCRLAVNCRAPGKSQVKGCGVMVV